MRVVLFIHVEVFDESFLEKIVKGYDAAFEELDTERRLALIRSRAHNAR